MESFNLTKMETTLVDGMAWYRSGPKNEMIDLNPLIGQELQLIFKQEINCSHCHKKIKKTYSHGLCYPCSLTLASADMCILKPEQCHYAGGTCREPLWGEQHCMTPHYVYLANSSGLKVGITRATQIPTRWIDQGAVAGLPIFKVSSRYQSGICEKLIATLVKDKTDWRKMLKGPIEEINLEEKRDEIFTLLGTELDALEEDFGTNAMEILENHHTIYINYPVTYYPEKINSLSFDKQAIIGGKLLGIKGQYLLFDTGVINLRGYSGYKIEWKY